MCNIYIHKKTRNISEISALYRLLEVEGMRFLISVITAATIMVGAPIGYFVTPLASDMPGVAPVTDPGLINPWGITANSASPFWLSLNGSGTSELYNGAGVKQALTVTIPGSSPSPTGVVFNGAS